MVEEQLVVQLLTMPNSSSPSSTNLDAAACLRPSTFRAHAADTAHDEVAPAAAQLLDEPSSMVHLRTSRLASSWPPADGAPHVADLDDQLLVAATPYNEWHNVV